MKKVILVLWLIMLIPYSTAQSPVTITAPAVQRTPSGLEGVLSYITVHAQDGSGHVYIDTWPLAEVDIQGSARLAVQVACDVVDKDWEDYDFFITVRSDSPIIGGPSAGGAMTVAVIAALQKWDISDNVVMSGTINPDETVGPVGGLFQKAQAASTVADTFLVPEGQTTILVEEQKAVQQGPFTYITTTQKEVDLVEEGKKMGLTVEEVYDIRDAVYIFTGNKIELPHIEGEPIKADFMKIHAQEKLQQIEGEYTAAQTTVNAYTGPYKEDVEALLESAHHEITYAREAFASGDYYTSVSASFVTSWYISYSVNLLAYVEGQPLEDIFGDLEDYLTQLSEEIKKERPYGMTALQCVAAAQKRVFEAEEYLMRTQDTESVSAFIEYASYAQRRGESAEFWLNLAREYQGGDEIGESALKNAASSLVNTAELSLVYASSILPRSSLLQEAEASLDTARREYMAEVYCASLFSALESKVYSEVALVTTESTRDAVSERVERARERTTTAIERSRMRGIEPVLAVSYYELAASSTDPVLSLIYLGYAEEIASIDVYIESQSEPPADTSAVTVEEQKTEPKKEGTPQLLFVAIGILCGICISWVAVKIRS
jgi:uncharacterized protein